jgi:hypothetical protein
MEKQQFEGTPLDIALRDCGIAAFAIVDIAMEIGIEPTVRHGADLGYIPVVVKDACGFGHRDAAARSIASLEFAGDALLTNVETICAQFRRASGWRRATSILLPGVDTSPQSRVVPWNRQSAASRALSLHLHDSARRELDRRLHGNILSERLANCANASPRHLKITAGEGSTIS